MERIHQHLRDEFLTAKKDLEAASHALSALMREVPSGVPYPDSVYRIDSVSKNYAHALYRMMVAVRQLNEFLARGTVPDGFKDEALKDGDVKDSR